MGARLPSHQRQARQPPSSPSPRERIARDRGRPHRWRGRSRPQGGVPRANVRKTLRRRARGSPPTPPPGQSPTGGPGLSAAEGGLALFREGGGRLAVVLGERRAEVGGGREV